MDADPHRDADAHSDADTDRHPDADRDQHTHGHGDADRDTFELVFVDERKPEKGTPLKTAAVVDAFAPAVRRYGAGEVGCDSHERDEVAAELARHDLSAVPLPAGQSGKAEQHLWARRLFREGRVRMPKHPRLRAQLGAITSRPAPGGGLSISSPTTADGSHGDVASAFIGALWMARRAVTPAATTPDDNVIIGDDFSAF